MKKIISIAASVLCAALASAADAPKPAAAAEPAANAKAQYADPNPYAEYGKAMASEKGFKMAVEWQAENAEALEKATSCETLEKLAGTGEAMDALLAKVAGAYGTDPIVATQIAAVTARSMCTKCPKAPAVRDRWTAALLKAARESKDDYRAMFFLDQLRWCGKPGDAAEVRKIGENAPKAVKEFAALVAGELESTGPAAKPGK